MTTAPTTQVYQVFIRATPQQVWDAITRPEFTERYFYDTHISVGADEVSFRRSTGDEVIVRGSTIELDPPRRLVHTWLALYDEETAVEQPSRVSWEIEPQENGTTKLTVVHDQLEGAPKTATRVAGGWSFVLSGLKTLVETGEPLVTA